MQTDKRIPSRKLEETSGRALTHELSRSNNDKSRNNSTTKKLSAKLPKAGTEAVLLSLPDGQEHGRLGRRKSTKQSLEGIRVSVEQEDKHQSETQRHNIKSKRKTTTKRTKSVEVHLFRHSGEIPLLLDDDLKQSVPEKKNLFGKSNSKKGKKKELTIGGEYSSSERELVEMLCDPSSCFSDSTVFSGDPTKFEFWETTTTETTEEPVPKASKHKKHPRDG